jgi:hypothetical protein
MTYLHADKGSKRSDCKLRNVAKMLRSSHFSEKRENYAWFVSLIFEFSRSFSQFSGIQQKTKQKIIRKTEIEFFSN